MKGLLSIVCALLFLTATSGFCQDKSSPNAIMSQSSTATNPYVGVAVDDNYVFVLRGDKLYKYAKADVNTCGTPVPPCCPPAAQASCVATGSGPCPVDLTLEPSSTAQQAIYCMETSCGTDVDKAYLIAMMQNQASLMATSLVAAQYASRTSVQDFAINAASDIRCQDNQYAYWLRTKFCVNMTICPQPTSIGKFDICNPSVNRGREFDVTYLNEALQFYVDEVALSQAEVQNGKDCVIITAAKEVIKRDQAKIDQIRQMLCR